MTIGCFTAYPDAFWDTLSPGYKVYTLKHLHKVRGEVSDIGHSPMRQPVPVVPLVTPQQVSRKITPIFLVHSPPTVRQTEVIC